MESFIYADLNRVCRDKDRSKIKYYGAFAAALSFFLDNANKNLKTNAGSNKKILYRGIKISPHDADFSFTVGDTVNLTGYTSTSKQFECALEFALQECKAEKVPVVLQIQFMERHGYFELAGEFTAYPEEEEVLIQDGLQY